MAWVVDTCLVIDVLDDDPDFGAASARALDDRADRGLVLCPVSYVELAPAFLGDQARQQEFLSKVGISFDAAWQWADTVCAHRLWESHIAGRRRKAGVKRPVADVLIAAFASRFDGLLTRNGADFRRLAPDLRIVCP